MHDHQQVGSAVVIAAKQFNPSVLGELWLFENEILTSDELKGASVKVFMDGIAQVDVADFALTIIGPQLQFVVKDPHNDSVLTRLNKLVTLIPHTPFTAIGINHTWRIVPVGIGVHNFSRKLFVSDNSPFAGLFAEPDSLFGGYFSKDVLNCRLKVDAQPTAMAESGETSKIFLTMNFNFHLDLSGSGHEKSEAISGHLSNWENARALAQSITEKIAKCET